MHLIQLQRSRDPEIQLQFGARNCKIWLHRKFSISFLSTHSLPSPAPRAVLCQEIGFNPLPQGLPQEGGWVGAALRALFFFFLAPASPWHPPPCCGGGCHAPTTPSGIISSNWVGIWVLKKTTFSDCEKSPRFRDFFRTFFGGLGGEGRKFLPLTLSSSSVLTELSSRRPIANRHPSSSVRKVWV